MSDVLSEAFEAGQHPSGPGFLTFGTDRRLMVRFFTLPVLQPYQSNTAGRPVYVGQDMIEVRQPGERDAVIRPAHSGDTYRFPKQWEAFQAKREQVQDGIPLANLFPAEPEVVEMLKELRIHTVEALAGLTEQGIGRVGMGGRAWVKKATDYLDGLTSAEGVLKLQAEVAARDVQINDLMQELRNTASRLEALENRGKANE